MIIGANGCGKSTLMKTLSRLLKPGKGQVVLDGKAVYGYPSTQLAQMLGLLPQSPTVPEGITVADLVARGRYPYRKFIQGHKRHLSEEDKARLKASVDARYKDKAAATGSIMLCELQGATEDFIFRWNVVFQEHPEVLIDKVCQKKLSELMDRMMSYLKTVKEEKL